MKPKFHPFLRSALLTAVTLALGIVGSAQANTYTWGGGNSNWSDTSATGWNGGPPVGGDTAAITNGTVTADGGNQQQGVALTIGSGGVLNNGGNYLYFSGGSLTLDSGTINISNGGDFYYGSSGFGATVTANSGTSSINNTGAGYNMSLESGGTTFTGDGNLNISIGLKDHWTGAAGITKSGSGTLTLTGGSAYSGGTTVNQGTLVLSTGGGAGAIRGTLTINSGATCRMTVTDALGYNGGTSVTQVNINGGTLEAATTGNNAYITNFSMTGGTVSGTGRMDFSSGYGITTLATNSSSVFSAPIMLRDGNNMSINVADGAVPTDLLISSAIVEQYANSGITKSGGGTLTLSGANTYSGGTTISGGTLQIGDGTDAGSISGSITDNGALFYDVGSGSRTQSGAISGSGSVTVKSGTLNLTTANNNLITSGGLTINNGGTVVLQNYNPMGSVSVTLPVTINSGGFMTMDAGWSVHIGPLILNGGDLSSGGNSDPAYGSYYLDGDVTAKAGATSTISAVNIISGGVRTFDVESGGTLNVTGGFSNLYTGAFGLSKIGTGTMTLSGVNSYNGNTSVDDGTFELASGGRLSFRPTTNGTTNQISGSSTATLSYLGTVNLDLSGADATVGNTWAIVDLASFTGPAPTFNPTLVTSTLGDFSEATPGVWELPVIGAKWVFTEATASLTYVSAATDFDTWGAPYGISSGSEGGDLDGDSVKNQAEYAFGLIPNSGASVNPITSLLNKSTGQFTYQRRDNGLTGLTYTIWYSTDLATWTQDTGASQPDGTPDGNGVETITVTLTPALLTNPKLFIQVRAN